jgi:hypothetical protein
MGNVITNLKARFGVDNADFKKGLKDGEKAVDDFKGAAGTTLDEFANMFGVNMGAVNDAINTALKSLNFVGQSLKAVETGAKKSAVAWNILKTAMISSGIGALVVALGSLVAYFNKTGEGADNFAKILDQVKSVINNVIERLAIFGKGVYEIATGKFKAGWETMKEAFKGIGDEIREDWKAAGALAEALDALDDKEIGLINSLEERRAKVAELRLQAKEEMDDQKAKLSLLTQAESVIKSIYGDQISLESERLKLMKERIALQTKDPTDEQRRELAEQEAKINSLYRAQAEELRSISREKNAALRIVSKELELEKAKSDQIGITKASLENLKMPSLAPLSDALAPLSKTATAVKGVMADLTSTVNQAFADIAIGFGEFLGTMALGDANFADFGKMVIGAFADMAIQVGKIILQAGIAVLALKKSLDFTGNPLMAIVAGTALIAIGTAVKGALSSAASGGGSASAGSISGSGSSGGSLNYITQATAAPITIQLKGEFVQKGTDLVAVINEENTRKYKNT